MSFRVVEVIDFEEELRIITGKKFSYKIGCNLMLQFYSIK